MKSQSDNLLAIVGGILTDVRRAYPTLKGLDLDLERLSLLVSNRGLGVFTLDLPALESKLLQGLETGFLNAEGAARRSKRYPVPRLFSGLWMKIFDRELCLRSDADINAIMFLRQLCCLGKKIEVPCSRKRTQAAIKEYINVEQSLIAPSLTWGYDSLGRPGVGSRLHLCDDLGPDLPLYPEYNLGRSAREKLLLQRCQRVADFVAEELGTYCPECHIEGRRAEGRGLGLRHGPGAVAERSGKSFDKFLFTSWSAKLEKLYPWEMGKMPNDDRVQPKNHEVPARLITVPKTAKGPRIIAAEPSEHMFCQNLFASWIEERIEGSFLANFINLHDQSLSGELVLKASLDQSLATIDLSSASDRLSLWVIERVFRRNPSVLNAIHASRTRWLRLPNGEALELKKFASQGTALTFPIQTIVFLVIVMAACLDGRVSHKNLRRMKGKVRVYGDDIIIPNDRYADTTDLLTLLQLKVNRDKSFSKGYFRESCGVDAFKGFDITPVKPKTVVSDNPASCLAVLDTTNNLFYKGYWNASVQLERRQRLGSVIRFQVVGRDAGATGYGSFSFGTYVDTLLGSVVAGGRLRTSNRGKTNYRRFIGVCSGSLQRDKSPVVFGHRVRWNRKLHRYEVRIASIRSDVEYSPYASGYSGLLHRQLCPGNPSDTSSAGFQGVPERPRHREVKRWEALELLCSRS